MRFIIILLLIFMTIISNLSTIIHLSFRSETETSRLIVMLTQKYYKSYTIVADGRSGIRS